MMVTVKYVLIILRADNEGEGGTFSCYSLLARYVSQSGSTPIAIINYLHARHILRNVIHVRLL
jgi:K+ transporter